MTIQDKLMRIKEYPDGDSYWRIACDCSDSNHDVALWFDASSEEKEWGTVNLNLSMEIGAHERYAYQADKWWYPISRFFEHAKWRISLACKILFTGHHTMSGDVILDLEGIKAMQMALDEGIKHAKASI
jgi:hypothetical protein